MRKLSKTLVIATCVALLWTPLAHAAPGHTDGLGLAHWGTLLQELVIELLPWGGQATAAGHAVPLGSSRAAQRDDGSTANGSLGDPSTQVSVIIDPDG